MGIDIAILVLDILVAAGLGYSIPDKIRKNILTVGGVGPAVALILFSVNMVLNYHHANQILETQITTLFVGSICGAISSIMSAKLRD